MAICIGACRVCAHATQAYLDAHRRAVPYYTVTQGLNGCITFTIHINGDPRTAEYRSLFATAWRQAEHVRFPYHGTRVQGNTISCMNY